MHPGDRARVDSTTNRCERLINAVKYNKLKMRNNRLEPKGNAVSTRVAYTLSWVSGERSDAAGEQSGSNLSCGSKGTW